VLTNVCLVKDESHSAEVHFSAAQAALCHEKSIKLTTLPNEIFESSNTKSSFDNFVKIEKIDYLIPVTQPAADYLSNINTATHIPILYHAVFGAPNAYTAMENGFIAYTKQNGSLLYAAPFPSINSDIQTPIKQNQARQKNAMPFINKANQSFKPVGGWCLQSTKTNKPEQISVHVATFLRQIGINLWLLPIFEANKQSITITRPSIWDQGLEALQGNITLSMRLSRLYLDMDDTLYVHGHLNPNIVKLLETCKHVKCPVSLITRHFQDPEITLASYNIFGSGFDDIIWITDSSPKSNHIKPEPNTIFIDDSFQERQEVAAALNIHVYSPDIAEILIPIP